MNNAICKSGAVWHPFTIVQQVYVTVTKLLGENIVNGIKKKTIKLFPMSAFEYQSYK